MLVHNCGSYFHDVISNERFVKALQEEVAGLRKELGAGRRRAAG